jgi:disulfide bond formation protein DsbB
VSAFPDLWRRATPAALALVVLAVATATIGGAWIFEALGYAPCELCLKQRIPYYSAIPLAVVTAFAARQGGRRLARAGFVLTFLLFLAGAGLAVYHSGVELKIFPGPTECTGASTRASSFDDFRSRLEKLKVPRCDAPNLFVLGLTLGNWNILISTALAAAALAGWRRSSLREHAEVAPPRI